jgi:DNA modification methylase
LADSDITASLAAQHRELSMSKPADLSFLLDLAVVPRPVEALKPASRNARGHSTKQITQIAASIRRFGFVSPVLLTDDDTVLAGHGRLAAARSLGMASVPTIRLSHLSAVERRAYALADNRLAELAGWDEDLLAIELQELAALDLDFDLEITGFDGAELDDLLGVDTSAKIDPDADAIPDPGEPAVTRVGDVWRLGEHRLLCGDAGDVGAYQRLLLGEPARMVFTDPPYNVRVVGNVGGKGRHRRREFVMASGEMTSTEFTAFLTQTLGRAAAVTQDGSIHYICMDWRHMAELLAAGSAAYTELKNLVVWAKTNGGMGAFYRSAHELVFVFKKGDAAHLNTFGLGEGGRFRTNVWSYPGVNTFKSGRDEELALHPTVKPVALVADAIRDVSHPGDIVLDPFGGSGTTLIAAEKTRRRARLIELDPLYCDVICRRWQRFSKSPATLETTGEVFEEMAQSDVAGEARDV